MKDNKINEIQYGSLTILSHTACSSTFPEERGSKYPQNVDLFL
jgi:hypothetical protein